MNDYANVYFGGKALNGSTSQTRKCSQLVQRPLTNLEKTLVPYFLLIFFTIAISATVLNSTIFILYFKNSQFKRKRSVKLLLSLSVSDLSVGIIVAPISIAQILTKNIPNCHFINFIARAIQ